MDLAHLQIIVDSILIGVLVIGAIVLVFIKIPCAIYTRSNIKLHKVIDAVDDQLADYMKAQRQLVLDRRIPIREDLVAVITHSDGYYKVDIIGDIGLSIPMSKLPKSRSVVRAIREASNPARHITR